MLKKLVIFSFALFLFSVQQHVFAQSNILILNIEKLFADSKAGKSMISQVQKKQEAIKSQRDKAQKDLSDKVQKLDSQKSMMAPDALQAKADELKLEEIASDNETLKDVLSKVSTSESRNQGGPFEPLDDEKLMFNRENFQIAGAGLNPAL